MTIGLLGHLVVWLVVVVIGLVIGEPIVSALGGFGLGLTCAFLTLVAFDCAARRLPRDGDTR